MASTTTGEFIVRVRGIPFSAGKTELLAFFAMCKVKDGKDGVHFTYVQHGRPSGEAFVVFESDEDLQLAVKRHKEYMGSRYIEVFAAQQSEFEWTMRRNQFESFNVADAVLRLRGCPFGTTKDDVLKFFEGLDLVEGGVVIPNDEMGRPGGEAYAQFRSKEIAEEAMKLNREKMGHRYIELFKSSLQEMKAAERGELPSAMPGRAGGRGGFSGGRPGPYDRMEGMGGGFGGRNIKGPGGRGGMGFRGGMGGMGMGGDMDGWGYGGDMGYGGFGGPRGGMGGMMMGGGRGGMGMGFNMRGGGGAGGRARTGPGSDHVPTTGHAIHMRGLPWKVSETDICCFFAPTVPAAIHIHYEPDGRATGTADVDFNNHEEASDGMKKSGEYIDTRYIDLFLNSDAPANPSASQFMMDEGTITRRENGFTKTVTPSRMGLAAGGLRAPGTEPNAAGDGPTQAAYGVDRAAVGVKDDGWGGSAGWGGTRAAEEIPQRAGGAGANGYNVGQDPSYAGYGGGGGAAGGYGGASAYPGAGGYGGYGGGMGYGGGKY